MIKYKFLNYQTYQAFKLDLDDQNISDESIVFIQDVRKIWARGAEYSCNTQVLIEGNTITLLNSDGDSVLTADFSTKEEFDDAVNSINSELAAEINRAIQEESRIDNKLNSEIITRNEENNALSNNIDEISQHLNSEILNREAADTNLLNIVNAEAIRSGSEENRIEVKLDSEISNRKTLAVTSAEYVNESTGNEKKATIYFKNNNGDVISSINVTDFIIDGMVDNVSVVDYEGSKGLKIVFNTDSGKQSIVIAIGDLFEVDNYYTKQQVYTKTEVDNKETSLLNLISNETLRAIGAEEILAQNFNNEVTDRIADVNAEETRAKAKEDEILASLNAEISNRESAIEQEASTRSSDISALQNSKQDKLTAGNGININNNVISVNDYIGERDINGKLNTLQQMLGLIYVLKQDVYLPEGDTWSEAPIYSFGDVPSSGGGETPNNTSIYALNQQLFNVLEQNNELRNDVCYFITD